MNTGKIVQVSGPVIDIEFETGKIPKLRDAITVMVDGEKRVMEVSQIMPDRTVRCIMLSQSEDLQEVMKLSVRAAGSRFR